MLYVGIDPGESWCGFAALDVTSKNEVRVEARTYSVKAHNGYLQMAHDLVDLLPHARQAHVVCEDFRIRRSGHQHFNAGNTLRFLGALEYGVTSVDAFKFFLVPPNDHGERETKELFGRILYSYRKTWPRRKHHAWGHCVSAWRVLGNHMFHHERDLLLRLLQRKRSHRCEQWLPALVRSPRYEHIAPAGIWVRR
jgi:hypothetical protein